MILLVLRRLNEQFYCTETKNRFGLKLREKKKTFCFCFRPISFGGKWGCSVWFGPTKKAEARFVFLFLGRYASIDKLWSSWAEIIDINFRSKIYILI